MILRVLQDHAATTQLVVELGSALDQFLFVITLTVRMITSGHQLDESGHTGGSHKGRQRYDEYGRAMHPRSPYFYDLIMPPKRFFRKGATVHMQARAIASREK